MVRLGVVGVRAGYSQKEAVGKPDLLSSPSWYLSDPCLRRKLSAAQDAPQTTVWREQLSVTGALGVRNCGHCSTLDLRLLGHFTSLAVFCQLVFPSLPLPQPYFR